MEKVDLIYTWVDGNDAEWQKSKQEWQVRCGGELNVQAIAKGRFVDNEELRYSLRSVEKNMEWINRIHIVTADQTPAWLNTDHPKINLVSHRDILPEESLPTFNSTAIEMGLPHIDGLAERFIVANDDMFVLRPITPEFFYNAAGLPIARFGRHISQKRSLYLGKVRNAQRLVQERFGTSPVNHPHHNMDAYLKSDVLACDAAFGEYVRESMSHRFRSAEEFHRSAWLYYAVAQGRAEERIVEHYSAAKSRREELLCRLLLRYCTDSKELGLHRGNLACRVRKYNPSLLCLNDTERTSDANRREMKRFLERKFPNKSSFEK